MEKPHHSTVAKELPLSKIIGRIKKHNKASDKIFTDKNILQKLFHPDYILFDWEFFSRELEFE